MSDSGHINEPFFPWNDCIEMTTNDAGRAIVLALSAVFDAVMALRADLAAMTVTVTGPTSVDGARQAMRTTR